MNENLEIAGGADPEVAAAIAAVVDQVIRAERARDTGAPPQQGRSAWVEAGHLPTRPVVRSVDVGDDPPPGPPARPS